MGLRVAITGGIACGKSLFTRFLTALGVACLDTDEVVHRLEAPGGAAVPGIRGLFGDVVMAADGGVDRRMLGVRVFQDADARARLNGVVHPLVRAEVRRWLDAPGPHIKAVAVPLLFEAGWENDWDIIICVTASEAVQLQRLMCERGLSEEQARLRMAAQMPVSEKAARSQIVVRNESDVEALSREAQRVFRLLTERSE